ncbi:MAG TPA: EscT/YscT/HrcT family type III secretion system export apparatus protein [Gammaproteobacteria bacterium]|nr:EscT/YscT/HrcT family type III secretion system export apparatus protein [Gammaproteobacteria bacterium]
MDIIPDLNHWFMVLTVSLPRIMVIFNVLPFFGRKMMPAGIRNALAVSLSVISLPIISNQFQQMEFDVLWWFLLIGKEAILGLMIGYVLGIIFWAVAAVGVMIDTQRGAMSARLFSPMIGGQTSITGALFAQLAGVILLTSGGFLVLMKVIYVTYVLWPVTSYYPMLNFAGITIFLELLDSLMYIMLLLAGPLVIVMFLTEMGFALVGRFVPQINVFLLAMPVKSALSYFLLAVYVVYIVKYIHFKFLEFGSVVKILDTILK